MKKKVIITVSIVLLLILGGFLLIKEPDVSEIISSSISKQPERNVFTENERDSMNETDVNQETNNESEQTIATQLKELITGTVESTIDLFKKDIHITAIGDSITAGVGDPTNQGGYVGLLDQTINHDIQIAEFTNFGKSGNRSDQLLKRLEKPEIVESIKKSDIVLITIGSNDMTLIVKENITNLVYSKFVDEQDDFKARLHTIFETIEDINSDASIYLLGFYNPFDKFFPEVTELNVIVDDWNEIGKSTTDEFENTAFIPIKDLFDEPEINLLSDDNFHPNYRGYRLIAERVLDYLMDKEEETYEATE